MRPSAVSVAFGIVVAMTLGGLLAANAGRAEEAHSVSAEKAPGKGIETMSFYTGDGQLGTFPGTLVCLRCELTHAPGAAEDCMKLGHRHALSMADGSMIHPLLAGTEDSQKKINSPELHAKKVKVRGKYYPSTGFILVADVLPAS